MRNLMKLAIVSISFFVALSSCANSFRGVTDQSSVWPRATVTRVNSVLIDPPKISPNFRQTRLSNGDLTAVYFTDETHGFVGGQGNLYKTVDGGETWEETKFTVPASAQVTKILFATPEIGWSVLQTRSDLAIDYEQNHFWLQHTIDGGQTWKLQYDGKQAEITALAVKNAKEAWITGLKFVGLRPFRYTYLALHTADQGDHWLDVSKNLKDLTARRMNVSSDEINEGVMGVVTPMSLPTTVLTSEAGVLTTSTDGSDWQPIQLIPADEERTSIRRFGLSQTHNLWILGSTDSLEGVGSMLMVQKSDTSWVRYGLAAVYLSDAVALAQSQFVACGYFVNYKAANGKRKQACVLYSRDGGQNWSVIYRDSQVESINSLCAVNGTHLYAVGANGLVIRINLEGVGSSGNR